MFSVFRYLALTSIFCSIFGYSAGQQGATFNILDFGAVPDVNDSESAQTNSQAIQKAFQAASQTQANHTMIPASSFWSSPLPSPSASSVLIPSGHVFFVFRSDLYNVSNVALIVNGRLAINDNVTLWQTTFPPAQGGAKAAMYFVDSMDVTIRSDNVDGGTIDGQGYNFWWATILSGKDNRPHMFLFTRAVNLKMNNLHLRNSPQFHANIEDSVNVWVSLVSVRVDVVSQQSLLDLAPWSVSHRIDLSDVPSALEYFKDRTEKGEQARTMLNVPTFPLNTDGFDPQASNVLFEDVDIENFDDAIAVKPCHSGLSHCTCSGDMLIRRMKMSWSVGLTIGSVPPRSEVNCVRNVTWEDVDAAHPIKLFYIKSNPGNSGSGIVDGIRYHRVVAKNSLWYPLWIGPQQQHQPGDGPSGGTGCSFLYPLNKTCATQPLVSMSNIEFVNVTLTGGLTLPGVILANSLNPYTNITFDGVSNAGSFLVQKSYVCQNANVVVRNSNPDVVCEKVLD